MYSIVSFKLRDNDEADPRMKKLSLPLRFTKTGLLLGNTDTTKISDSSNIDLNNLFTLQQMYCMHKRLFREPLLIITISYII